jgi:hypothetical protein
MAIKRMPHWQKGRVNAACGTATEGGFMEFRQLRTSYPIPRLLQHDIDALEEGVKKHVLYVDCLQDEVRSSAHGCTGGTYETGGGLTEEQAEEIITYYCRRRWD